MSVPNNKSWRVGDDGIWKHDADCAWWDSKICTCGLLHHFIYARATKVVMERIYPDVGTDIAAHDALLEAVGTMWGNVSAEVRKAQTKFSLRPREAEKGCGSTG